MVADTPSLPNIDIAGVWALATRALDKANDVAVKQAVIDAKLDQHLAWCVESREIDRRARDQDRLDAQSWRMELGRRLNRSDAILWGASLSTIVLLLGIVGFLLTHGAVKFGG